MSTRLHNVLVCFHFHAWTKIGAVRLYIDYRDQLKAHFQRMHVGKQYSFDGAVESKDLFVDHHGEHQHQQQHQKESPGAARKALRRL
jgi:hypothetical protein